MLVRTSLIALALAAAAGTAFAAPATPAKAPAKTTTHAKCEKRSAAGHCEKWASKTDAKAAKDAGAKPAAAKPAK